MRILESGIWRLEWDSMGALSLVSQLKLYNFFDFISLGFLVEHFPILKFNFLGALIGKCWNF